VLRRAPILAVVCLLALPACAWASLPGTPKISVGNSTSCWVVTGTRGGSTNYCTYYGTQFTGNGWSVKGRCAVTGTYAATLSAFQQTHAAYSADLNSYAFTLNTTGVGGAIDFQLLCPLTWTGSAGLSWGKAITGGTTTTPIWTLHVRNTINQSRQAHCVVSYRNDLNQTKHYTWSPTVPAEGSAKTRIRVWHVNSMSCSYTLTRTLQSSGSA
jgi:hypothetical protein